MKKTLILAAATALIFAACGSNANNNTNNNPVASPTPAEIPLSFETVKDSLDEKNLVIKVEYLRAKGKGSETINEIIGKVLCDNLTMGDSAAQKLRNHKDMFAYLKKAQKEAYAEGDMGAMMEWGFELSMSNFYQSASYLCLSYSTYTYAGGAHPNTYSGFVNVDLNSNKELSSSELVDSAKVMPAVHTAFREFWKGELEGTSSYEAAGFFVDKSNLPLPANIGINDKKAIFYYNNYEIAAYVMGHTSLEVPLDKLAGGIKVK